MFKYILIVILAFTFCGAAAAQDINIYNGYGYGRPDYTYYSGYSYRQPTRHIITPSYGGYYNPGPGYLYSLHRAMGREKRRQEHIAIWSVKRVERIEARYRNYARISNRTGYDPGGPTKLDEYYKK